MFLVLSLIDYNVHHRSTAEKDKKNQFTTPFLCIPREDVFLAWLDSTKIRKGVKKIKVVTLSYPKYSWLKDKVKEVESEDEDD